MACHVVTRVNGVTACAAEPALLALLPNSKGRLISFGGIGFTHMVLTREVVCRRMLIEAPFCNPYAHAITREYALQRKAGDPHPQSDRLP
jgi:hypothetical protein